MSDFLRAEINPQHRLELVALDRLVDDYRLLEAALDFSAMPGQLELEFDRNAINDVYKLLNDAEINPANIKPVLGALEGKVLEQLKKTLKTKDGFHFFGCEKLAFEIVGGWDSVIE